MEAITQAIVNYSTLDVSYIKITNATKDTFLMSIQSRVNKTGPIGATMSEMTVEMAGPAGTFGHLDLPVVKTSSSGADVTITDQLIKITDMAAFRAFVKSLMNDEKLTMKLKNGNGTIKSLGMTSKIFYQKDVHLKGMNGPKTVMVKTEVEGSGFKNEMLTINPSAFEIDMGVVKYEIRNAENVKIAEQKGKTHITRGESTSIMTGTMTGEKLEGDARLVGVGVEEESWHDETIRDLNTSVKLSEEFVGLCGS
ncbi:uncharacterized protein LY89DRAFT_655491 [Mollisia scopiformis]|uniref:Uncharacterized protein n=1 Tax=Mollisia scopiformis TaxID=149040 RepID=A0A194WSQ0_MOLSC|nr:uncharacterized protein LY89DRAFT_655491 [Mollisia scopiformis]KUJ10709.1 hypothetical protein LY89DRAFT_655491 [Mollisia scopiformis]